MGKLVRDKIPEIIRKDTGREANVRMLGDDEYLDCLLDKLLEEALELKNSAREPKWSEEMADVFEVIYAILELKGSTIEDIVDIQKKKRDARGGFEKRIYWLGD